MACVNGAAAEWPRNGFRAAAVPIPGPGVNGAAAEWPRNALHDHVNTSRHLASMGPRPSGRGTLVQLQGDGVGSAASMGPRPSGRGTRLPVFFEHGFEVRQWGRGRVAAERGGLRLDLDPSKGASMGPRPSGRGTVSTTYTEIIDD